MSFHELIDQEELQQLQDTFCQMTGVFLYCLDKDGVKITELSGNDDALAKVQKYVDSPQIMAVLERVEEGSLEDMVVEELSDGVGKVATIAVKADGDVLFYWIVFEMGGNKEIPAHFQSILDLLSNTSHVMFRDKLSTYNAEAESKKIKDTQKEMSDWIHALMSIAEIVQLLDNDEAIEQIMEKWLEILSLQLQVDSAQIFQLYPDKEVMDVVCEWREPSVVSSFDKTSSVKTYSFLYTEKPLVISTDKINDLNNGEMYEIDLKAVMIFPIIRREDGTGLVVSLNYRRSHTWEMVAVKFAADAVRVLQSIITRRVQKNSLAGAYAALEAVLDNVGCAIYVTDKNTGAALFTNRKLKKIFEKEINANTFYELIEEKIDSGREMGAFEIDYHDGECWYDVIYKEISWVDGRAAVLHSLYDITDKKLYQKRIEQQAYTDFLTGLYNRMCCERDLAKQIDEVKKSGETGAILYLDLDDFKHINDGLGHLYGDVLLKSISRSLQQIDGIQNTCYRMGGDEFVIVVPPVFYAKFEKIIEDIKQIFNKPWFLKDADYYCTMSMGIVTFPDGGDSVLDLIKKADIAMYEAKKSGKNRVAKYIDGIDSASGKRLDMEKNMRDATADGYGEFEVYYQPIIDIQNSGTRCVGAEALVRWNSTKLGFISPAEFIPLAEYLGLINPIGNYVLKEACRHCKEWNEKGYPDYKVNVNLSVVQLLQPGIVEIVERILKESGLNPKNLTLEVTESLAINDMERMKEILSGIKALGVSIALDDFGTGYSSLNHIREIPFDVIKVDRIFVKDMTEDAYSQSFVKMVAELAQTIGVHICVEGVETAGQHEILQGMKVKYVQGYYFDRPMTRTDFENKYVCAK